MATDDGVLRRWFWPTMDSAETAKSYVNIGVIALAVYSVVSGTLMAFASPTPLMHTLGDSLWCSFGTLLSRFFSTVRRAWQRS